MNREEKQLELAMEVMLQRINEMKTTLSALIMKLEHDHRNINCPVFLDSFSVVSGQVIYLKALYSHGNLMSPDFEAFHNQMFANIFR